MALTTGLFGEDAGTIVSGQRATSDVGQSTVGRNVPQWFKTAAFNVSENTAPLTVLLDRLKKPRIVRGVSYNHLEDDNFPGWVEIDSFTTDGDGVSLVLASNHGKRLTVNDTIYVPRTDEVLLVSAIATDTITVTRGLGSSSATTLVTGEDMAVMAKADSEGNTAPGATSNEPTIKTNYCQIEKLSWELTGRLIESELTGGDEWNRLAMQKAKQLQERKERAFLWGARTTSGTTTTGGLKYYVTTNVDDAAGALTEATLNTSIKKFMRRNMGQSNLVVLAGELTLEALNRFGREAIVYKPEDKVLGIKATTYRTAFGDLSFIAHGQLVVNSDLAGQNYFLNLDKINAVEFGGRGYRTNNDVEAVGTDGKKSYLLSDFGFHLAAEKSQLILEGVTG